LCGDLLWNGDGSHGGNPMIADLPVYITIAFIGAFVVTISVIVKLTIKFLKGGYDGDEEKIF